MTPGRTHKAAESKLTSTDPESTVRRLRAVHRATAEQRRGIPVLLGRESPLIVLAAETAGATGLADLASIAAAPPVLVLSPVRAASVLRRPVAPVAEAQGRAVAFRTAGLLDPALLQGLADPTADQLLAEPPLLAKVPPGADAALVLAKLARLLPAMLVAPARPDASAAMSERDLLQVPAEDVLRHPAAESDTPELEREGWERRRAHGETLLRR